MAHKYQKTITITEEQCEFIKENYLKMSQARMAQRMKITKARVENHIKLLGLVRRSRTVSISEIISDEYYNENEYKKTLLYQ